MRRVAVSAVPPKTPGTGRAESVVIVRLRTLPLRSIGSSLRKFRPDARTERRRAAFHGLSRACTIEGRVGTRYFAGVSGADTGRSLFHIWYSQRHRPPPILRTIHMHLPRSRVSIPLSGRFRKLYVPLA